MNMNSQQTKRQKVFLSHRAAKDLVSGISNPNPVVRRTKQQSSQKGLGVISHQENANGNRSGIPFHTH